MRRLRFSSGLILGLVLGLAAGTVIGLLLPAARSSSTPPDQQSGSQMQDLIRQLEAAQNAKERADHQLEVFAKLADEMTATFKRLEERFTTLAEAEHRRDQVAPAPPPANTPPATPTVAPTPPPPAEAPPAANPG